MGFLKTLYGYPYKRKIIVVLPIIENFQFNLYFFKKGPLIFPFLIPILCNIFTSNLSVYINNHSLKVCITSSWYTRIYFPKLCPSSFYFSIKCFLCKTATVIIFSRCSSVNININSMLIRFMV